MVDKHRMVLSPSSHRLGQCCKVIKPPLYHRCPTVPLSYLLLIVITLQRRQKKMWSILMLIRIQVKSGAGDIFRHINFFQSSQQIWTSLAQLSGAPRYRGYPLIRCICNTWINILSGKNYDINNPRNPWSSRPPSGLQCLDRWCWAWCWWLWAWEVRWEPYIS